ncbi:MAG: hypothetical protein V4739_11730 [Pseudomonadota bacterium]
MTTPNDLQGMGTEHLWLYVTSHCCNELLPLFGAQSDGGQQGKQQRLSAFQLRHSYIQNGQETCDMCAIFGAHGSAPIDANGPFDLSDKCYASSQGNSCFTAHSFNLKDLLFGGQSSGCQQLNAQLNVWLIIFRSMREHALPHRMSGSDQGPEGSVHPERDYQRRRLFLLSTQLTFLSMHDEGYGYCDRQCHQRAQRLHPTRPHIFGKASCPPVDPQKTILNRLICRHALAPFGAPV